MKRFGMTALAKMKPFAMFTLMVLGCMTLPVQAAGDSPFTDFADQPRTIESFAGDGRWLVVMIWAHDCHVCNIEAENYAHFHEAHKDKDAHMLGISMDGQAKRAEAEAFIERHDLPFPNLIGEPAATMRHYMQLTGSSFRGTPTILLYGPDGALTAAQAGAVPPESIEKFIARGAAAASTSG
jgi:peroxiredoxin